MKKADAAVLGFVIVLMLVWKCFSAGGERVCIYVDSKEYKTVSLNENITINIETEYGKNTVTVRDGKVFIDEADCPDKLCQNGKISKAGQSIVCLPNRVSVLIEGKAKEKEADVLL